MAPTVLEHVYGFLRAGSGYTGGKMTSSSIRVCDGDHTESDQTLYYWTLLKYTLLMHMRTYVYMYVLMFVYIYTDGKGRIVEIHIFLYIHVDM